MNWLNRKAEEEKKKVLNIHDMKTSNSEREIKALINSFNASLKVGDVDFGISSDDKLDVMVDFTIANNTIKELQNHIQSILEECADRNKIKAAKASVNIYI